MTKHKILQYILILVILIAIAGGYFYYRSSAAQKINSSKINNLTSGLVGYWTFDGADMTATTALDKSSASPTNTGTLNSTTASIGKIGQGLKFDSNTDYVSVADPGTSSLDISTGEITISAWMKLDSVNSIAGVSFKGNSTFKLTLDNNGNCDDSDGKYEINFLFMGFYSCSAADIIDQTNKWYYITVTRSATQGIRYYVDGSLVGTALTLGAYSFTQSNDPVYIGNISTNSVNNFPGTLDEVRIYNRALSQSEVTELYQQGQTKINASQTTKLTDELINYWTMDGANVNWGDTTTEVKDVVSSNHCNALGSITSAYARPGKIGQGLFFDGAGGDRLDCGDIGAMDGAEKLTVSLWVNPTAIADTDTVFAKGGGNLLVGYAVDYGSFYTIVDADGNGNSGAYLPANWLTVNNWYHVVMVYDGTQVANSDKLKFYTNNSNTALDFTGWEAIPTATASSNANSFLIGSAGGLSPNGVIDEVRVYNRALSQSEITELYQEGQTKVNASQDGKLESGLVGYWTMDGADTAWATTTTGTVADRSSSSPSNTGTLTNMSQSTSPVIGKIGQAMYFDGSDDSVVTGTNASLDLTASKTIAAWIKPIGGTASIAQGISVKKGTTGKGWRLVFEDAVNECGDDYVYFSDNIGGVCSASAVPLNAWTHVVGINDVSGNASKIYINGILNNTGTVFGTASPAGFAHEIGKYAIYQFKGSIDEVRVYDRALSASEVMELYNMGR